MCAYSIGFPSFVDDVVSNKALCRLAPATQSMLKIRQGSSILKQTLAVETTIVWNIHSIAKPAFDITIISYPIM